MAGLPTSDVVAAHTEAQKGAMTKGVKPKKALAKAAAGPVPGSAAYQAQQEIDPIIAAIKAAATTEAGSADKAIEGLTNSYAKGIAGINYGAPYSSAEAQQAAVDNALQQGASGQGSSLAAALSQRLSALQGSSGAGAVNQEAAALTNQGAGIGSADLASGSAELGNLIADAAAAKNYGNAMPGVVRSAGLQGIAQAQGQAQTAINQGTLQAESDLPSIIQQIKADRQAATAEKQTAAYQQAEIAAKDAALQSTNAYHQAEIQLSGQRNQIAEQRIQQEAVKAAQSNKAQWARIGIEDQRLKLEIAKQNMSATNGGLSAAEVSRYSALADSWASRTATSTVDPTTGKVEKAMSPEAATVQALKEGVPLSMIVPAMLKEGKAQHVPSARLRAYEKQFAPLMRSTAVKLPAFAPASYGRPKGNAGVIMQQLAKYPNLDPKAVLAIASMEGLGGGIGDNGTSFGPFQMHMGGALPAAIGAKGAKYAQAWAWSPAGIDYALRHIAAVAGGLKGQAAVAAISRRFERPANPGREIAGADARYGGM